MNNFRKLAVATAVSAALGGTATVNALQLADPGGALLVPYGLCDTAAGVNTLVGIVQARQIGIKGLTSENLLPSVGAFFDGQFPAPAQATTWTGNVHWFFYSPRSRELASGAFPVTHDDFAPFDWCQQALLHDGGPGGPLDGQDGYIVFVDNAVWAAGGAAGSILNLFGDAAVIQGNWGAAAWLPVIPMRDLSDTATANEPNVWDEVAWSGGVPNVNPINAGQPLGDDGTQTWPNHMDLRFFLGDLGLGGDAETDLIFWFDQNYDGGSATSPRRNYSNLSVNVFDEDEVANNTPIHLPDELNVIDARTIGWTITKVSGFIEVILPESDHSVVGGALVHTPGDGVVGSSVSLSLVWFGPNATDGVQTLLAHNRGLHL